MSANYTVGRSNDYPMILAQIASPAGAEIELYRVPPGTHVWIDRILFTNTTGQNRTYCVALCPGGKVNHPADWIVFDHQSPANEEYDRDLSVRMNPGDTVRILSDNDGISFQLFGMPI